MNSVLRIVQPKNVIQIISHDNKKNYPCDLDSEYISQKNDVRELNTCNDSVKHTLHKIQSVCKTTPAVQPKELREAMIMAYFSKMLTPPDYHFACIVPYCVPFSGMYIGINAPIAPSDVLKALNGVLVSLETFSNTSSSTIMETSDSSWYQVVIRPELSPSLGLGIIRGIDVTKKEFYILTPVDLEDLKAVNMFKISGVSLPSSVYLEQNLTLGPIPYTAANISNHTLGIQRQFRA